MPINPSWKKLVNQVFVEDAFFVHLLHQRPDFFVGKLADVVAKHDFVFGEGSQGAGRRNLQGSVRHESTFKRRNWTEEILATVRGCLAGVPPIGPPGRRRFKGAGLLLSALDELQSVGLQDALDLVARVHRPGPTVSSFT